MASEPRDEAERVARRIADHTTVGYVSKQLLVERIASAIRRAVKREREACAQTALDCECVFTPGNHCKTIAKAIRARK